MQEVLDVYCLVYYVAVTLDSTFFQNGEYQRQPEATRTKSGLRQRSAVSNKTKQQSNNARRRSSTEQTRTSFPSLQIKEGRKSLLDSYSPCRRVVARARNVTGQNQYKLFERGHPSRCTLIRYYGESSARRGTSGNTNDKT